MSDPPSWNSGVLAGVKHGFFGRAGGVSTGLYASLNAGTGSNDDPAAVAENRRRIAAAFNAPATHLVGVHQVHSPDAVFINAPWPGERPKADALVTTAPGLVISVLTADCTPVLLADVHAGVIGAAHAGWKGAISGVLDSVVRLMRERGATNIAAAIGPTIGHASYEVGPEFEARFIEKDSQFARYFAPGAVDRRLFDLPAFCADQLRTLDITQIETLQLDTYARPESLHSHRYSVHQQW
ncbi:MAG TPA: peptidoglycan editing factor PgeF, partial [Vitreimonas sp.]|nr:peptidoglycan editing factor PgeF [Vitreimonas sp.]